MTAVQENLTRAQRVILGKTFEVKQERPLIKEGLGPNFPHVEVFSVRDLTSLRAARGNGLHTFQFRELPTHLVACESSIVIAPESFTHPISKAKYRSEMEKGPDVFLLNYIAEGDLTTYHVHPEELTDPELLEGRDPITDPIIEEYDIVHGTGRLHFVEGDEGLLVPSQFSVRAGVTHQMEGGSGGTIFAIVMRNAALYPADLRHIPVSLPNEVSG